MLNNISEYDETNNNNNIINWIKIKKEDFQSRERILNMEKLTGELYLPTNRESFTLLNYSKLHNHIIAIFKQNC